MCSYCILDDCWKLEHHCVIDTSNSIVSLWEETRHSTLCWLYMIVGHLQQAHWHERSWCILRFANLAFALWPVCQLLGIAGGLEEWGGRWHWMTDPDIILHLPIGNHHLPHQPLYCILALALTAKFCLLITASYFTTTWRRISKIQCNVLFVHHNIATLGAMLQSVGRVFWYQQSPSQSNRQCLGAIADPRLPKRQISFWTCNFWCFHIIVFLQKTFTQGIYQ